MLVSVVLPPLPRLLFLFPLPLLPLLLFLISSCCRGRRLSVVTVAFFFFSDFTFSHIKKKKKQSDMVLKPLFCVKKNLMATSEWQGHPAVNSLKKKKRLSVCVKRCSAAVAVARGRQRHFNGGRRQQKMKGCYSFYEVSRWAAQLSCTVVCC